MTIGLLGKHSHDFLTRLCQCIILLLFCLLLTADVGQQEGAWGAKIWLRACNHCIPVCGRFLIIVLSVARHVLPCTEMSLVTPEVFNVSWLLFQAVVFGRGEHVWENGRSH